MTKCKNCLCDCHCNVSGHSFDWKVQTSEWNVEDSSKWKTEDTDKYFYGIEETKNDKV